MDNPRLDLDASSEEVPLTCHSEARTPRRLIKLVKDTFLFTFLLVILVLVSLILYFVYYIYLKYRHPI